MSPVRRDTVLGKGIILVPSIGLPALWIQNGQPALAAAAVFVVILVGFPSRYGLLKKHDPWHAPEDDEATRSPDNQAGLDDQAGPGESTGEHQARSVRRWAVPVGIVVAVALAAAGAWLAPKPTRAAFTASSASTQNLISTAAATNIFYLKTNAAGDTNPPLPDVPLDLTSTAPTLTTLYNYGTLRDPANPGLLIAKGTGVLDPIVGTTMQRWAMPARASTVVSGNASARLWTAMKDFSPTKTGSLTVGLFICNPGTNNCSAVGTPATVTRQGSWSGGSTTWVPIGVDLGSISIPTNRVLQIRVTVGTASSDAMMLAYDTTAYPSRVTVG